METVTRAMRFDDDKCGEECKRVRYVFNLSASEQSALLQDAAGTIRRMQSDGFIAPYGCDCRTCQSDGDCCGRFTLSSMKSVLAGNRLIVLQRFYRNI